jgi:hypothetical protein
MHMNMAGNTRLLVVGTWRLVSAEQRLTDDTIRPSPIYGPHGAGYLMYGSTGRMCVILVNPDRPSWSSEDEPTPDEIKSAIDGFVAYYGSYEVNESEGFVLHHIEAHIVPNWVGADQKRYFDLSGNRLTLKVAPPLPKGVVEYKFNWERA